MFGGLSRMSPLMLCSLLQFSVQPADLQSDRCPTPRVRYVFRVLQYFQHTLGLSVENYANDADDDEGMKKMVMMTTPP